MPDNKTKAKKIDMTKQPSKYLINLAEIFNRYYHLIIIILVVFSGLLAAFIFFTFYFSPVIEVQQSENLKQAELEQKQKNLEDLKSLKVDYESLEADVQNLFYVLPDEKDLPDLYVQIENIVTQNNLDLQSINITELTAAEEAKPIPGIDQLSINLTIGQADYFRLKSLLNDIENSLRLLDVASISYSSQNNTFSIILNTYYRPEG
jgi:Tfp pilus assembly protein PilO